MDREAIVGKFKHYILDHGSPPPSVYAFVKELEIGEREFFEHFGSFASLESAIWQGITDETIGAIRQTPEWDSFSAHQKLLTFYYAFCDRILDNRSFFLAWFPQTGKDRSCSKVLDGMRHSFVDFVTKVLDEGKQTDEVACRGSLTRAYPNGLFGHFISVIEFNLRDDSNGFERTDAYIEKSVKLAFDVIGTQAVDSAFDLVRFLTGRSWGTPSST